MSTMQHGLWLGPPAYLLHFERIFQAKAPQEIIKELVCVTAEGCHLLYLRSWQMSAQQFTVSSTSLHLHEGIAVGLVSCEVGRSSDAIAGGPRRSYLWYGSQLLQPPHLHQDAALDEAILAEDVSQTGHLAPIAPVACIG